MDTKEDRTKRKQNKLMPIEEFRKLGILHEVNRQFLHPLGLALEVVVDDDGNEKLSGIWDSRDDAEGIAFAKIDKEKMDSFEKFQYRKHLVRKELLGYIVQQEDLPEPEDNHE